MTKNNTLQSEKSDNFPQVYKEEEFELMLRFIRLGLWRNTNLARVCGVNIDTITAWKKRPETKKAYREAAERAIKKRQNVSDPEKIMKELGFEIDPNELTVKMIEVKGLENL